MRNFMDLRVSQEAHVLTLGVYQLTRRFPCEELYGLTSQIRRPCSSIEANLTEGCGLRSDGELARFIQISMGSASELACHLLLARDLSLLCASDYPGLYDRLSRVRRMLTALLQRVDGPNTSEAKSQKPTAKSHASGQ